MSLPTIDLNWTELFAGLKVDETHVRALLAEQGLYGAARILGYDVNHYHNLSVAGRLTVEHMRTVAPKSILAYAEVMKGNLSRPVYQFIQEHSTVLQSCLDKTRIRDYDHDWFSANTLYTTYSAAPDFNSEKAETPQYIWMRIALELYHDEGLEEVLQCYHDLSIGYYTPASPTIFNAGFVKNQMASCFLMSLGDNLESILRRGIHDGGIISKHSGGLGVDVSRIRHSEIQHAGWSSGVVPMLQMFNSLTYYVNQCFDPDTYVYTERGPIPIRDVVPGDRLIIYNGTFHEVAFLMPHDYQGSVVELKVQSSFRPVKVAVSHPLLVKRNDTEEWVDAGRIKLGEDVAFPVPKLILDREDINIEDMYMYGLMIGGGSISREGECKIEVAKDHPLNLALFIRQYLGVRALSVKESPRMDQISFEWKEHSNFRFTRAALYNAKEEKCVHPHYLHLPRDKTTSFIAGLMTQSGSYGAECKLSFSFECLAENVRYLLLRLGYPLTCSYRENKMLYPLPPVYQIKFPRTYEIGKFFNDLNFTDRTPCRDTLIWSEVQQITAMPYQGRIYDLQMTRSPIALERSCTDLVGSANYLTQVGLAHNGGRRKGAATIFLRSHHIDIEEFIEMPRKVGDRYARAHDLNICIWTSWLFWERLRADGMWTLFCPAKTPQLNEVYGKEFERLYLQAEVDTSIHPRYRKQVRARDLYHKMITTMNESGMPYLMNGDAANLKSNHRHLGYIKSSNLCLEIIEYTDDETIAVCNLHSLSLRTFAQAPLTSAGGLCNAINFPQLALIVQRVTNNLNKVIDHNWYPLDKRDEEGNVTKPKVINKSNKKHRPVGMGVSGFAELLHILDLPFEDPLVSLVNKAIFACMYWNALAQSVQLALIHGPYESFPGSPTSEGKLQFDLWREEFEILGPNAARCAADDEPLSPSTWNQEPFLLMQESVHIDTIAPTWEDLKRVIKKYGLRNSLLIALMPTASTAQVRRNCESVEAHQNNLYSRKVLKCSYPVLNRFLVADLDALGAWNDQTVEFMQVRDGSIQGLGQYILAHPEHFPNFVASSGSERMRHIERKYKTMWEIPQKVFMKLAAERGRYVDQSASTNIYLKDCQKEKLQACHLYANMLGLKTIMYYLRQSGGETVKFTAEPSMIKYIKGLKVDGNTKEEIKPSPEPKLNELEGQVDEVKPKRKVVCTDEVCLSCT